MKVVVSVVGCVTNFNRRYRSKRRGRGLAYQLLGLMLFCSLVGLAAALGVLRLNRREQAPLQIPVIQE